MSDINSEAALLDDISALVYNARAARGMTLQQFGDLLGVSNQYIYQLESRRIYKSVKTLIRLKESLTKKIAEVTA